MLIGMVAPGAWGAGGFGVGPWGGAPGVGPAPPAAITMVNAIAVAENVVRVWLSERPYADGIGSPFDALNAAHYSFAVVGGTGLDGKPARPVAPAWVKRCEVDDTALDVTTDRMLSPYPCEYTITATSLMGDVTGGILVADAATFKGLLRTVENALASSALRSRDLATPQAVSDTLDPLPDPIAAVMGSFNADSTGDYAHDEGLTAYKKRIMRRIYCRKRRFVFLPPEWGVGVVDELKRKNSPDRREAIRSDIHSQVMQEPETADCLVETLLSTASNSVVSYHIYAKTHDGRALDMTLPFYTG